MRFHGQEYWSELPFSSPGDHLNPGIEPMSPVLAGRYFAAEALSVLELSTMDTSLKAIFFSQALLFGICSKICFS